MANDDDEGMPHESTGKPDGIFGDALKKVLTTGITAAFMTEEAIRSRVSELKLPKETLNMLLAGATKSKEDLMNRVSNEVIRVINKIDFVKEASRFVEEHKFKITAEVEVTRKEGSATVAPGSSVTVTQKSHRPENQEDV